MFEEGCFICGKPTSDSLYCSKECKLQDANALSPPSSSHGGSVSDHPLIDVPALSPYHRPSDSDSDVPEQLLSDSALQDTPSTSPTSSVFTDADDGRPTEHERPSLAFRKSLPTDIQGFDHEHDEAFQRLMQNYKRPPALPSHPNLAAPRTPQVSGIHFARMPAKVNGFVPSSLMAERAASDSHKRPYRSAQSSPSRRHSFPTLLNLGLNLPSPQGSPHLRPAHASRPTIASMTRHSSSSYSTRPKLNLTSNRPNVIPKSPRASKQPLSVQTEAQAIAAHHRASNDTSSRSRTPAPRQPEDMMTTPTQKDQQRGRSRQRMSHGGRSRSRSRQRSALRRASPVFDLDLDLDADATVRKTEGRRGSRGALPTFGIGGLRRNGEEASVGGRDEARGRRGRAP